MKTLILRNVAILSSRLILRKTLLLSFVSISSFALQPGTQAPENLRKENNNAFAEFLYTQFEKYPTSILRTFVKPDFIGFGTSLQARF